MSGRAWGMSKGEHEWFQGRGDSVCDLRFCVPRT